MGLKKPPTTTHSYFMLGFALRSPLLRYYWIGWERYGPGFLQDLASVNLGGWTEILCLSWNLPFILINLIFVCFPGSKRRLWAIILSFLWRSLLLTCFLFLLVFCRSEILSMSFLSLLVVVVVCLKQIGNKWPLSRTQSMLLDKSYYYCVRHITSGLDPVRWVNLFIIVHNVL